MKTIILSPAYGRDYTKKADVIAALCHGSDFIIEDVINPYRGGYINIAELMAAGFTDIELRYNKKQKVTMYKLPLF